MSSGLAGSALRGHRAAFVGTAVAALFAAAVVSASTTMLTATDSPGVPASVSDMATVLLTGSVYMSIFAVVVVSTMGTAVAQQHRELALVRAIGWAVSASVAGGTLLLTLLATGLPVRATMRRRAITTVNATA